MEGFFKDLRYALRVLGKSKSFTIVVIIALALGIGANTAIFTILNAIFFQPLAVEKPNELMAMFTIDEKNSTTQQNFLQVSYPNFQDFQRQTKSFTGMLAFSGAGMSLSGKGEPEQLNGLIVTGNYFDLLGVKAALGRTFLPEEDQTPNTHPVVVLSNGLWKRQFGANPQVIGTQITLNNSSYTVIGVTPENFRGTFAIGSPDFFVPMMMHEQVFNGIVKEWFNSRRALLFAVVGRLKPDITRQQAESEMKTIASQLEQEYPKENEKRSISLVPLNETTVGANQRKTFVMGGVLLMGVVALVLLIACTNIANLLIVRVHMRRREIAIRVALGASRWSLFRQFMTESLLLSVAGGVIGLCLAVWGRDLLWSYRPMFIQQNDLNLNLDTRVLVFTLVISLLTGLIFGIVPAIQASQPNLITDLREKASQPNRSNKLFGIRNVLIMLQVAFSLISLVSASLFLHSLFNAQETDLGFETKKLLTLSFDVGSQRYDKAKGQEFYRRVQEQIRALPGVKTASLASNAPLSPGFLRSVFPEGGDPNLLGKGILTLTNNVGLKHFETLNIPLLQGRDFAETDKEDSLKVCIINQAMAKRFWPGLDPIGKRFKFFGDDQFTEIVGLVKDSKQLTIGEEPTPCAYVPLLQLYTDAVTLYVQSQAEPKTLLASVRSQIQALDNKLPLTNVTTMTEVVDQNLWAVRMTSWLLVIFGLLALTLSTVGIYGILAYSVSQRTQEIGIRMALGAMSNDVLKLVLSQAMKIVAIGIGLGMLTSLYITRLFSDLLFSVSTFDPITFLLAPIILAVVAFIASYIPAYKATKVDPLVALRCE